ncbi:MAG: hypothetical protein ABIP79_10265 [Chitinophagaceae bacterium]
MRYDKLDKKIIEAAENHHPAYDEKAWHNMEKLLDKHLPQEKKRRRRFIFILLFFGLLGGAGLWYLFDNNKENKESISQSVSANIKATKSKDSIENNSVVTNSEMVKDNSSPSQTSFDVILPADKISFYSENKKDRQSENLLNTNKVVFNNSVVENQTEANRNKAEEKVSDQNKQTNIFAKDKYISEEKKEPGIKQGETLNKRLEKSDDSVSLAFSTTKTDLEPILNKAEESVTEKKGKTKSKKNNFFFLSLSAGPDISVVGSGKAGSVKIAGGAGIGYTMKNGLSLRTGFYSGRKVYTSSPEDYHPPSGFFQYYPILENIAADCLVYEIPLSVSYNFKNNKKGNWFAGAAVSSLIMKSEKYSFDFKYSANGPIYKGNWSVNNKNKHYFSILTLSGGYQRQLSKTVSLSAEPYLKTSLKGVGYGKVNLNSAGVMFSLSVKPFNSRNKK